MFLAGNIFLSSNEKYLELITDLQSNKSYAMTHRELESFIFSEGRELMRRLLEDHIRSRGTGDIWESILGKDGIKRSYKQLRSRKLISVFGKLTINRVGYSQPGERRIFPLDGNLNLTGDIYSFGLRRKVAYEVSKNSFTEAIKTIESHIGVRIPKRQSEELSKNAAIDFENYYESNCTKHHLKAAKPLSILALTTDGKGIVVRKKDLRECTKKKLEESQKKRTKRMSKGEKKNRKRMAFVASVYSTAEFVRSPEEIIGDLSGSQQKKKIKRPRPFAKRVWASLEQTHDEIIKAIFEEALQRDSKNKKKWVCLVDGDRNQLKNIRKQIKKHKVKAAIILDIIQVIEYLWKASTVFHKEASKEAEKWVNKRLLEILHGKAGYVAGGMRRSATLLGIVKSDRKAVDVCATYLLNNSKYLRYNEYLNQGFPIATGVIEGACRHLIKDRMDITGARWSLAGAEAVLKLRSLRSSGDFDDYWDFHEQKEFQRNHQSLYYDPRILNEISAMMAHAKT